ncbi:MAG: zinc ribbon domain-containing protein [Anaerobutyricum sp.]
MKCPRCGTESRIRANDEFCHKCGHPLKIVAKDGESTDLKSFFLDVDSGIMLINGKEVNNVTAFSLNLIVENTVCALLVKNRIKLLLR